MHKAHFPNQDPQLLRTDHLLCCGCIKQEIDITDTFWGELEGVRLGINCLAKDLFNFGSITVSSHVLSQANHIFCLAR